MAKQNKKDPTKKEMMSMIFTLEQRVLTLHMFMDAMSNEFAQYLMYKDDTDGYKQFKEKYEEKEEPIKEWGKLEKVSIKEIW